MFKLLVILLATNVRSVFHGSESISCLGSKIWGIVPSELKELTSVSAFKKSIEDYRPKNCPCRLCKKYALTVGFITVTSCTLFIRILQHFYEIYCVESFQLIYLWKYFLSWKKITTFFKQRVSIIL